MLKQPEAVRKHDGRIVAFDGGKLAGSIMRAALSPDNGLSQEIAKQISERIARIVGMLLVEEQKGSPASADIRAAVVKTLRETKHEKIAAAYAEHARNASGLLWRVRVVDPGTPFTSSAGSPWDRRRLLESLRASGIARDPAGDAAREVERRLVTLSQERVSPALIHALAMLVLAQRSLEIKTYGARRVAFSLSAHVPFYDAAGAAQTPLPQQGPALEGFWLQAVHCNEVLRAVRENILSLEPYPFSPQDDHSAPSMAAATDPLLPEITHALRNWYMKPAQSLWVRAETPERLSEIARYLSMMALSLAPESNSGSVLNILLKAPVRSTRPQRRASPVTINAAGLIIREALRDQDRATVRLAQSLSMAVQAHREREEYFNLSPVRGRSLPIAIAGLWNASAWLRGENFEAPRHNRGARALAGTLVAVLVGSIETIRNETGMELCLAGSAPLQAVRQLWIKDREFLMRDGVNLDPNAIYDGGPTIKLLPGSEDFGERLDFAKAIGSAFEEPPALTVEAPFGSESDPAVWREFVAAFAQAGVPRLQLIPGGNSRGLRNLVRAVRSHLEGFPLLEQAAQ